MDRKLIRQINALQGDQFNFQPGRVSGILLYFLGVNSTGETGALADLGSVVVTRDNRQIVNAKVSSLGDIVDIRFGSNLFSSTTGAAFIASVFIPFFESDDNDKPFQNALAIVGDSELNFEWIPASGIATVFDSLSLYTYAELSAWKESYEYRILRDDQTEGGAVAGKPYQINKANVSALYLTDPDDIIDLVQLEQNSRSVFSPQPWDVLLAGTLRTNRLEVSTFDMIQLPCYSRAVPASAVNRDTILSLTTSGAGDVGIVTTSMHLWGGSK